MSHALIVSRHFPFNPQRVPAACQRPGAQVEALARLASHFFVPPHRQRSAPGLAEQQAQRCALGSATLKVQLATPPHLAGCLERIFRDADTGNPEASLA